MYIKEEKNIRLIDLNSPKNIMVEKIFVFLEMIRNEFALRLRMKNILRFLKNTI